MSDDDDYRARLEDAKRSSVGQLLIRNARRLHERAIARARDALDLPHLRPSHFALFPYIDLEGTRITEIAQRAGITKQAVAQVVSDLESMGIVTREPDPEDGRAKRVVFTAQGRQTMLRGLSLLGTLEAELQAKIGKTTMTRLHEALLRLDEALDDA